MPTTYTRSRPARAVRILLIGERLLWTVTLCGVALLPTALLIWS